MNKINLKYKTKEELFKAYMPFLKNGGLFIPNKEVLDLETKLELSIDFFNETSSESISSVVVWQTPKGAGGGLPSGFGVQFQGDNSKEIVNKIETYLAGMLNSSNKTDTI